ncbi:MAG: YdcH family protein [Pacificimonas sp.]|jgi:hypothetical protein|nr:YdcH family protein [Pacificimonas sp.]
MGQARTESLTKKHAQLESAIADETHRPQPDDVRLHQLKKEKLAVRDQMAAH